MPAGLPLDESPADGSLFVARKAGTLAEQARIVASVDDFPGNLLQAVGEVRDSNPTGVRRLRGAVRRRVRCARQRRGAPRSW